MKERHDGEPHKPAERILPKNAAELSLQVDKTSREWRAFYLSIRNAVISDMPAHDNRKNML